MKTELIKLLPPSLYLYLRWYEFKWTRPGPFSKIQAQRLKDSKENGGYKPFDDARSIFVHIPKCAGISVNKALFNSLAGGHTTLDQYINIFEPKYFQSYFKFTIVRNPWDRVVSAYTFLKGGGLNKWDNKFYEEEIAQHKDFNDFVKNWLNQDNIYKHHHFKPQLHYLQDKYKKVSVDFIAYLEQLDQDFPYICEKIGKKVALPKHNAVKRDDYRAFYDEETQSIVADIYSNDIAYLNYKFDGIVKPHALNNKA